MKSRKWMLLIPFCLALLLLQPGAAVAHDDDDDDGYTVAECVDMIAHQTRKCIRGLEKRSDHHVKKILRFYDRDRPDRAQEEADHAAIKLTQRAQNYRRKVHEIAEECEEVEKIERRLLRVCNEAEQVEALLLMNPDDPDLTDELLELEDKKDRQTMKLVDALTTLGRTEERAINAIDQALQQALSNVQRALESGMPDEG